MSIRQYWPITENDVYVKVFDEILNEVDHEFFDNELVESYRSLAPESRYLVTRLYIRSPKWIRFDDLSKYMAPETLRNVALPKLIEDGWLETTPPLTGIISDVASLTELQDLAKLLGLKATNKSRPKLVDQLIQLEKQQSFFNSGRVKSRISDSLQIECYFLHAHRRKFLFQLEQHFLFPVGPDATLETIFLTHMKKQQFLPYEYVPQKDRPIFDNPESFHSYADARELSLEIEEAVNSNNRSLQLRCVSSEYLERLEARIANVMAEGHSHAAYTLGRAIFNISQIFMKLHEFNDEYAWLQKYLDQQKHRSKRGVALIRKLLLEIRFLGESGTTGESSWLVSAINTFYDAMGEVNEIEMLDLNRKTTKLLASIRNTGLQSALSFIKPTNERKSAPRTGPKIPVFDIIAVPMKPEDASAGPGTRVVYDNGLNVEELALAEYATQDCGSFEGGHFEGSVITTIFWLTCYDLLFQNPEQFRCAYQRYPLNLQKAIDENSSKIDERLSDIERHITKNRETLVSLGEPRPNVGSISWLISAKALIDIVRGLGDHLAPIMRRLMSNYRKYASGFPDLTLWNAEAKRTKFVEVKSMNDTVSDNQQLWMEFMIENGVDVEICKVIPAKRVAKRKRTSK